MKLVIISDTHLNHDFEVPDGDVLIHCGDLTGTGSIRQITQGAQWLAEFPHKYKILVAGNHDWGYLKQPQSARFYTGTNIIYLEDSGIELEGIKFYGSPWQPEFNEWAFNLPRNGLSLKMRWGDIPQDTDVLITHGPPYGILDNEPGYGPVGCELLRDRVLEIKPRVHCFGHIHARYGREDINGTTFINASICNEDYRPTNKPWTIEI